MRQKVSFEQSLIAIYEHTRIELLRDIFAAALVPPGDLEQFRNLVVDEISQLHEGNIARFRRRPSEYRGWQAR